MKIQIKDNQDLVIVSELPIVCSECISTVTELTEIIQCPISKDKKRIGIKYNNNGGTCFACTSSNDLIKSKKTFIRKLELSSSTIDTISKSNEQLNENTRKFIHNLTKTNAHNIQELYALVPQDVLTKKINEQIDIIKKIILDDPKDAAKTFLRIAKNNASMKIEFSIFNKLMGGKSALNIKRYNIKKATLNILHIFFHNFSEKGVYVDVQENDDFLYFDYDTLHVIFYHIIDNATKYILPNSKLRVEFKENSIDKYYSIFFNMISIKINDDEKDLLFNDKYRGVHVRKHTKSTGQGIGLGRVFKILEVIEGKLVIHNNFNKNIRKRKNGIWFENNIFEVRFTDYAKKRE